MPKSVYDQQVIGAVRDTGKLCRLPERDTEIEEGADGRALKRH